MPILSEAAALRAQHIRLVRSQGAVLRSLAEDNAFALCGGLLTQAADLCARTVAEWEHDAKEQDAQEAQPVRPYHDAMCLTHDGFPCDCPAGRKTV